MTDMIGYDALTQAAMRGLVRTVLKTTQKNGAPQGDHHFYITFLTKAPGVKIANHLMENFPKDMTIVIQHQYWDLEVHDTHFEIILKFSGVPQHLHIPFSAVTRFVDPSVDFGLTLDKAATNLGSEIIAPVTQTEESITEKTDDLSEASNTIVNLDAFRRK